MTSEGLTILQFMQSNPDAWYSRKEISRRAVSRAEAEENPQWATAALSALVKDGVVEQDGTTGLYRIAPPKGSGIRGL